MEVFEGFELYERVRGRDGTGWDGAVIVVTFRELKDGTIEEVGVIEGVEGSAGRVRRGMREIERYRLGSKRG